MPLAYELIADSDVLSSAVTQYDFTALNYNKDDILLLVSDIYNTTGSDCIVGLFVNDNNTTTDYNSQRISVDS